MMSGHHKSKGKKHVDSEKQHNPHAVKTSGQLKVRLKRFVQSKHFFQGAFILAFATIGIMFLVLSRAAVQVSSVKSGNWSDAATWAGGHIPQAGDLVTVETGHTVTFDQATSPTLGETQIKGTLVFATNQSASLILNQNLIVTGKLEMKPANASITHTVRFVNIDESKFVGGGMVPLATDVGLWVIDHGQLNLIGAQKSGWMHLSGGLASGASSGTLDAVPTGWAPGDEITIAPTQDPMVGSASSEGFDEKTITSVSGTSISWNSGVVRPHPRVNTRWDPEIANLTRNVRLEGTSSGHGHVFVRSTMPQTIKYVGIRYMGAHLPQADDGVLGRYGLHLHFMGEASRTSIVQGTAVRDANNVGYVAHASHGATFIDDVVYNAIDGGFRWDGSAGDARFETDPNPSNDTMIDHMLVAKIDGLPSFRAYNLPGIVLAMGYRNTVRNSTTVGILGAVNSAGFQWPEDPGQNLVGNGFWGFSHDNVAHNNRHNGIFNWQNTGTHHDIANYTAYYNGEYGIMHGAYGNVYQYSDMYLYGNGVAAVRVDAQSMDTARGIRFSNNIFDGAGISDYLIESHEHEGLHGKDAQPPEVFVGNTFKNYKTRAVNLTLDPDPNRTLPENMDFIDNTFTGKPFHLDSNLLAGSEVRVQEGSTAYHLLPAGGSTPNDPDSGALKSVIAPFFTPNDVQEPNIDIGSPVSGSVVTGSTPINVFTYDNVAMSKVIYYVDGIKKALKTSAPYSTNVDFSGLADGWHTLHAIAYDTSNQSYTSNYVTIWVVANGPVVPPPTPVGDTTKPGLRVLAPAQFQTDMSPTGIGLLAADAWDDNGVAKVEVFYKNALVTTMTKPPYVYNWDTWNLPNGSGSLFFKVTDLAGNTTTSSTWSWTISNSGTRPPAPEVVVLPPPDNLTPPATSDTTAPAVSLTAPTNGATVSSTISVTANASDNIGVTNVEFYVDGSLKVSDSSSPYSFSLDTTSLSNASHALTAKAYDAAGNSTTSTAVTVTVNNTAPPPPPVTYAAEDINQDGHVNLLDFSLLASKFGQTTNLGRTDINGDGRVNLLDFSLLAAKFGT